MFEDASCLVEPEYTPEAIGAYRDVNSDVNQVLVYRQGFCDGADGLEPGRSAYAYRVQLRIGLNRTKKTPTSVPTTQGQGS
jgi:hypothetical protein